MRTGGVRGLPGWLAYFVRESTSAARQQHLGNWVKDSGTKCPACQAGAQANFESTCLSRGVAAAVLLSLMLQVA
jgi:hypothetical protein